MAKIKVKVPKTKDKKELRAWVKSKGLHNVDKATLKEEKKRLREKK